MKTIPLVVAVVNRDAMTKLPVTVPKHEVDVMLAMFGEDNVQITDENAGSIELDASEEGARLVGKYGEAAVVAVHGQNYKGAVLRLLESLEITAKPKGKAAATA
jgi:hypothetical protein